jgi:hypothetical protein
MKLDPLNYTPPKPKPLKGVIRLHKDSEGMEWGSFRWRWTIEVFRGKAFKHAFKVVPNNHNRGSEEKRSAIRTALSVSKELKLKEVVVRDE